jgi:hypothetical protein
MMVGRALDAILLWETAIEPPIRRRYNVIHHSFSSRLAMHAADHEPTAVNERPKNTAHPVTGVPDVRPAMV